MDFPPTPGGISTYLSKLWNRLSIKRSVLTGGGLRNYDKTNDYPIHYLTLPRGTSSFRRYFRTLLMIPVLLFHTIGKRNIVLHCGQVFACGFSAWILHFFLRTPYIVYTYGAEIYECKTRPIRSFILRRILSNSSLVFTISSYSKNLLLAAKCEQRKIFILRPGVDIGSSPKSEEIDELIKKFDAKNRFLILSVSRLVKRKGHDTVLRAISNIRRENKNILYLVAGTGPCFVTLQRLTEDLGIERNVLFLGHVSDKDLPVLYQACDIFILLPFEDPHEGQVEGFGIVYLEANTYGKPVIGSRSGGIPDAIQDQFSGILVPPNDSEAAAQAIQKLISDQVLRTRLGEQGKKRALVDFRWEDRAKSLELKLKEMNLF